MVAHLTTSSASYLHKAVQRTLLSVCGRIGFQAYFAEGLLLTPGCRCHYAGHC